ncbi:MAG TPA: TetR/AcrR family transcriptional regulator [Chryseosolibacter sp.]
MENPGDKKRAIFESTLDLIMERGFHGAPMSLVAKNAGVAAGTVYHYFESKEQLICELYNYNRERLVMIINSCLQQTSSYKEKFFKIWTDLYKFYVKEPNVLIFFEQFINSPFNVDQYKSDAGGMLHDFFAEGIKKGIIKSVKSEILLVLFMGSIHSTAKLQVFAKIPVTSSDLSRIVEILWDGITATKKPLRTRI